MRLRYLGDTGLRVSEVCFGTMTFGGRGFWKNIGEIKQKLADQMVGLAVDSGINFFDTADVYSEGLAEEMLGDSLAGERRKKVIVATTVRGHMGPGPNDVGLTRHHIMEGCEASLKRLRTDYIDLYHVHSFDPRTSLEETLRALDDIVRQGKVRYIGCSNFAAWQLMKALMISGKYGWNKFIALQAYYSLMDRDLENELMPLCVDQRLGILVWSPLAGGFLTGKYRRGSPRPEGSRRSDSQNQFLQFDEEKGFDVIKVLDSIAQKHNATVAQAALNYLLKKPAVTAVIIGVKTMDQLQENIKTTDWTLTDDDVAILDKITSPPRVYPNWFLQIVQQDRLA